MVTLLAEARLQKEEQQVLQVRHPIRGRVSHSLVQALVRGQELQSAYCAWKEG